MAAPEFGPCPPRFTELKQKIAASYPEFERNVTKAWNEVLEELKVATDKFTNKGSEIVPSVNFADLRNLSKEQLANIRKRGCVVIRDVVDDAEALSWRDELREYVTANPVKGFPEDDKQFFQLFWSGPQVRARSHPNVVTVQATINAWYEQTKGDGTVDTADLARPLSYADRFRMRHPGVGWDVHPPHVDGGSIERWEDDAFRSCFVDILTGNWRAHNPYELEGRVHARSSLYGRENQSTVFRTFQGWLAFSETAPGQGTLQVFPDVVLANAYLILRPFFSPVAQPTGDPLDAANWQYDISNPDFPGIYSLGGGFIGPRPNPSSHPHLKLEQNMISVPNVNPGDMVFWHCDLIHAVETEHNGTEDSCVMYIPAVPYTPQNAAYIDRQKECFLSGAPPPDFPKWVGEGSFVGRATVADVRSEMGLEGMGFGTEASSARAPLVSV